MTAVEDGRDQVEQEDMPLPHDPRTIFQGGLFILALIACLYVARDLVLPIVLAIVLKLLLQPLVGLMERIRIPRAIGAILSVLLLIAVFAGFGRLLVGPAATWASQLPQVWPKLEAEFSQYKGPIDAVQEFLQRAGMGDSASNAVQSVNPGAILGSVASGAGGIASHMLETLLVLLYLLISGDTFLRRLVEVLPKFDDKKQAIEISHHVQRDISAYLLTITLINGVVGICVGLVAWAFGLSGPVLWGTVAFFLNFVPILGPIGGVVLFLVLGLVQTGVSWGAVLPAACYLGIHLLEGEFITPMLLARRFTLNPVAVMVGLLFWSWLWGVQGAVLSVPLLAIAKIVCDRIRPFRAFGHLLEG